MNKSDPLDSKGNEELEYLGKEVFVKIDRPIRSKHPEFDFEYELNYGFIPNTLAGDGEEIDAYIIGEDKPLENYIGIVKAVIIRYNDNENKLVIAKEGLDLSKAEIQKAVDFQERFFDTEIRLFEK